MSAGLDFLGRRAHIYLEGAKAVGVHEGQNIGDSGAEQDRENVAIAGRHFGR